MVRKLFSFCAVCSLILSFFVVPCSAAGIELEIVDDPPSDPPFYGACYVTGTTSSGNTITLYFPNTYKSGYFGVDDNGYLVNVSASSISGYYSGVYNNSITVAAFNYPRYRSDYTYVHLIPSASNIEIETEFAGRVTISDVLPYVSILLLGVIFVCCMKRS